MRGRTLVIDVGVVGVAFLLAQREAHGHAASVVAEATCDATVDSVTVVADVPADQLALNKQVHVQIDGVVVGDQPVHVPHTWMVPAAPSHSVAHAYFWTGEVEPFGPPVTVTTVPITGCEQVATTAPPASSPSTVEGPTTSTVDTTAPTAVLDIDIVPPTTVDVSVSTLPATGRASGVLLLAASLFAAAGVGFVVVARRPS